MTITIISNDGPHSAAQWANATAQMLVDSSELSGDRAIHAQNLRAAIAEVLQPLYDGLMQVERMRLEADSEHLLTPLHDHGVESALSAVLRVTPGSPWGAHYAQSHVQDAVRETLRSHFQTVQYIERSWHADRNPDHPAVQKFRGKV